MVEKKRLVPDIDVKTEVFKAENTSEKIGNIESVFVRGEPDDSDLGEENDGNLDLDIKGIQ